MSDPILSYKKSRAPVISVSAPKDAPVISAPKDVPDTSNRKVSRRKALQEFYNINKESDTTEPVVNLSSEEDFSAYLKNHSIEEILRYRNSVASKYNSNTVDKKEIVYDNYYELIRLNQALRRISDTKETDIASVLADVENFVKEDVSVFENDFEEVVNRLSEKQG